MRAVSHPQPPPPLRSTERVLRLPNLLSLGIPPVREKQHFTRWTEGSLSTIAHSTPQSRCASAAFPSTTVVLALLRFDSYRRIVQPRLEERERHPEARVPHLGLAPRRIARVSKDGHKRDRASGHPSRRRFAPPQDEVCGFQGPSARSDWFHGIDLLGHDGSRPRAVGSLSEFVNKRGRSVIQIFERMPLAMIINPGHQYLSGFSSRNVPLGLGSVLIECGYKAKNPGRSGRCKRIVIPATFNPGSTRNIPLS